MIANDKQQSAVAEKVKEVSAKEYACRTGTTLGNVYVKLWTNKLYGRKVDGKWLIAIRPNN